MEQDEGRNEQGDKGPGEDAERPCQFCGKKELKRVGAERIWRCLACGALST